MSHSPAPPATAGFDIHDVLFAVFRHKWKIILCTLAGLAAAAAYYFFAPKDYQSETSLLVKYVLDRSAVDPVESQADGAGRLNDALMAAEVAILSSWDLALQVAEAIGPDRLLAGTPGEHTPGAAAGVVARGLDIKAVKGSNVITVTFHNRHAELTQPVLEEFVKRYFDKHLEVHRSTQAFDFVSQQKDLVRSRINDLDARIKTIKEQAGISSLADSEGNLQSEIGHTRQELLSAEAERAESGVLSGVPPATPAAASKENPAAEANAPSAAGKPADGAPSKAEAVVAATAPTAAEKIPAPSVAREEAPPAPKAVAITPPPVVVQQYSLLLEQLGLSQKSEAEQLTKYTEESSEVRSSHARVLQLENRRAKLEAEYPALLSSGTKLLGSVESASALNPQVRFAAVEAKIAVLKSQLGELQAAAGKISAVSSQLRDLESERAVEQKNYVDFQSKLEKSRIDEALDPSKIPNISVLQKPSPSSPVEGKLMKVSGGIAAGGIGFGLVAALGLGLVFDRSIKRPREIESRLHLPLWESIPRVKYPDRLRLNGHRAGPRELAPRAPNGSRSAPWEVGHFIRPFAESIRNRLILGFELKKITHKPKLVGVTSLSGGEGASTMAAGLAASLSETGDGKVLLVDMNADNPEMRPFFEGNASGSLVDALRPDTSVPTPSENLFLATGKSPERGSVSLAPKRFYELMPVLRASAFDYIIFDLPALDQSGATLAVSGFLDKLVLMVEAEKNDRDAVKRACDELVAANADVATVLNKTDSRMPRWALG